ncbi:MAG: TonB C-terminal domain-containing protein [Proteobacteria bacterium]|jgi:TonB family protein|nr:TonB C-terminal domain-containing protein [Pseudomonadota bacterium]
MKRLWSFIIISLVLHALSWAVLRKIPATQPSQPLLVLDLVSPEDSRIKMQQPIVRETLVPENLKLQDLKERADLLSRESQRVREQMKAARTGLTQNRSAVAPSKVDPFSGLESPLEKIGTKAGSRPAPKVAPSERGLAGLPLGPSTLGESLPDDIRVGSFTALNTDRYLFYSFFARIEELIRFRWEEMVERGLQNTPRATLKASMNDRWVTHLEVWLRPTGEFHSFHILKESGIRAFDQAAIQAFVQAKFFPNPPREMVEEDGFVRLQYSFQVNVNPQLFARP